MRHVAKAVALVLFAAGPALADAQCHPDQVDLRGAWGQAHFTVELADTDAERADGLMNRKSLPEDAGMLFIYPTARTVAFWMKNTLIPLDMIFLDATGTVERVYSNATPGELTPILGGHDIKAVLEINGGLVRKLGITPGTELRHPSFAKGRAAWGC